MRRIATAVLCIVTVACGGDGSATTLPDVEVTRLGDTEPISLSEIELPAVVNVWATTCAPCVREMPLLQAAADAHDDVDIVGLNSAETPEAVQTFIDELAVGYPQLLDQAGYAGEALAITSLPTTYAVAADGTIVGSIRGEMDDADLDRLIAAARGHEPVG